MRTCKFSLPVALALALLCGCGPKPCTHPRPVAVIVYTTIPTITRYECPECGATWEKADAMRAELRDILSRNREQFWLDLYRNGALDAADCLNLIGANRDLEELRRLK
jgi:hypothetical protein